MNQPATHSALPCLPEVIAPGLAITVASVVMMPLHGRVSPALTAGARRSAILLALILLPLAVPVVIFAAGAVAAAQAGLPYLAPLLWLAAALVLALALAPFACAAALRIALEA